jgi:hypothetical protein
MECEAKTVQIEKSTAKNGLLIMYPEGSYKKIALCSTHGNLLNYSDKYYKTRAKPSQHGNFTKGRKTP